MAWKGFYSKNFRWGICFELFPQSAKTLDNVYNTGFHYWRSSFDSCHNFSVVIKRFRIIVMMPASKKVGYCKGEHK